ncbi:MAG TPA: ATPase, T2SS/T4P/T4SS family [Planctomycetota bacterium]|nr:ATPase, T2SS/T4P/T4SS family [Planctomycetota bacterium]
MLNEAERYAEVLGTIPVFKNLKPAVWNSLGQQAQVREFWPGEKMIEQGAPSSELYVILEGQCKVVVQDEEVGFGRELYLLYPGDHFGEPALLTGEPSAASVIALTAGQALILNGAAVRELIKTQPQLGLELAAGMARHLEEIARKEVTLPFVSLDSYPGVKTAWKILPEKTSRHCKALVLAQNGDALTVGMADPLNAKTRTFLRDELRQYSVEFVAIGEREFERFAEAHFPHAVQARPDEPRSVTYVDQSGKEHELGDHQTAEVLEKVLLKAIHLGASDMHFEPAEPYSRIRMRLDGNMEMLEKQLDNVLFTRLISRLKVISDLDITNRRLPQDGRFPVKIGNQRVEVRLSVTPCQGGEKAVLRLLDQSRQRLDLKELISSKSVCDALRGVFRNSSGMILVTGPTGSGKTTTLYAGLSEVWRTSQKVNIVTIEDPVEYQLGYATQIQVNRAVGLDFAQILRTALRQDPDVILVGEIRDPESASIALETATTGHLVLSTLHTDSALEAIARLRKLNVKPYLMASAVKCVVSQRLISRICERCIQQLSPADPSVRMLVEAKLIADANVPVYKGKGCNACRFEGDLGRVGVYELMMLNEALRDLIEKDAPFGMMQASLNADNFISLASYSRYLLTQGIVSPEQIRTVFPRYSILSDQPA